MVAKRGPAIVLATALALLVASLVWTVASSSGWRSSRGRSGAGMMGGVSRGSGDPVRGIRQAKDDAQRFADRLGLKAGEVIEFERNYYTVLEEPDGELATEVLVDPDSGDVTLEYGPAMMWNTRHGIMGGHMGGAGGMTGWTNGATGMMGSTRGATGMMGAAQGWRNPTGERGLNPEQAERIANRWLRANRTGLRAGDAEHFPGYYTLETFRDDDVAGMMSVNANRGAVWYHTWHGRFRSMIE